MLAMVRTSLKDRQPLQAQEINPQILGWLALEAKARMDKWALTAEEIKRDEPTKSQVSKTSRT